MSVGERIARDEAMLHAADLGALIGNACAQLVIAGSLRRGLEHVGDIELVAVPYVHPDRDLFGVPNHLGERQDALHERVIRLIADGQIERRQYPSRRGAFGRKHKSLRYRGVGVDLFATTADQFGLMVLIRTGPADWSRRFVTHRSQGGMLPDWLRVTDGHLVNTDTGTIIPTPTEQAVFDAAQLPYVAPENRG
jgi:DNA polymerase/3'-5' exonuclease PolX